MKNALLTNRKYDPNRMFDAIIDHLNLKNDAALARLLEMPRPTISNIRHLRIPIGAALLVYCHEASGIGIRELKALAGIPAMDRMKVAS